MIWCDLNYIYSRWDITNSHNCDKYDHNWERLHGKKDNNETYLNTPSKVQNYLMDEKCYKLNAQHISKVSVFVTFVFPHTGKDVSRGNNHPKPRLEVLGTISVVLKYLKPYQVQTTLPFKSCISSLQKCMPVTGDHYEGSDLI